MGGFEVTFCPLGVIFGTVAAGNAARQLLKLISRRFLPLRFVVMKAFTYLFSLFRVN
jgi:hypothetical protein